VQEKQLAQILQETLEIEQMNKWIREPAPDLPRPRVLFGVNTGLGSEAQSSAQTIEQGDPSVAWLKLTARYRNGQPAFHMTVESLELESKIRVARTYFLTKNVKRDRSITTLFSEEEKVPSGYILREEVNEGYQA